MKRKAGMQSGKRPGVPAFPRTLLSSLQASCARKHYWPHLDLSTDRVELYLDANSCVSSFFSPWRLRQQASKPQAGYSRRWPIGCERLQTLRHQLFGEQAIVLAFDDRVTFASALL